MFNKSLSIAIIATTLSFLPVAMGQEDGKITFSLPKNVPGWFTGQVTNREDIVLETETESDRGQQSTGNTNGQQPAGDANEASNSDVEQGGISEVRLDRRYTVPSYAQPTSMSCWATGIAMMVSWRDNISIAPESIAAVLGYKTQFDTGGLGSEDVTAFERWGLEWQPPMSYTVQGFFDLLDQNGPLWVAGNPNAPHVRVVTGIVGDGTPDGTLIHINDPANGRQYTETFRVFHDNMERLGDHEMNAQGLEKPVYIAHF